MLVRLKQRFSALRESMLIDAEAIRADYHLSMGDESIPDPEDPLSLFHQWLREAESSEASDPNAAALATSNTNGIPSVRMVLVKRVDERGFCFFTNAESRKGRELAENPVAALCFYWKSLDRQVRIEGRVTELETAEVEAYFHTRSRRSQISAAVSEQSRPLASREKLLERFDRFAAQHPGEVPLPAHWRGYCLSAERIEFWIHGADRLHDRLLFTATESGWEKARLYP